LNTQLALFQQRCENTLTELLTTINDSNPIKPALSYATLSPGKRLRPALVYAIGQGFGTALDQLDPLACAIELIHSYSLVHDDLPAMDDDDLRRGRPTCHKQFDEATAILVGDAQQTLAFEHLSQTTKLNNEYKVRAMAILSKAAGAQGMILGQMIDIQSENQTQTLQQLTDMHMAKTGALIQAALKLGTPPGKQKFDPILNQLGEALGLAFQIQDDIIDIESDTETLGKTQGRDLALNKSTFPKLLGMLEAKKLRDKYIQQAHQAHKKLPFESDLLSHLIDFIAQRNY
jgi:geranylgeranyl pyrophosphate synthase